LEWEPIVEEGRIVGMICPGCMTYDDVRRRRDELARRGMPPKVGGSIRSSRSLEPC